MPSCSHSSFCSFSPQFSCPYRSSSSHRPFVVQKPPARSCIASRPHRKKRPAPQSGTGRELQLHALGLLFLHLDIDSRSHLLQLRKPLFRLLSIDPVRVKVDGLLIRLDRSRRKLRHVLVSHFL